MITNRKSKKIYTQNFSLQLCKNTILTELVHKYKNLYANRSLNAIVCGRENISQRANFVTSMHADILQILTQSVCDTTRYSTNHT